MSKSEIGSINREGFELRYVVDGKGMPAIVVGSSLYYPKSFSQDLRENLRMAFIDWRGFAESAPTKYESELTLNTFLEDIDCIRKKIGFENCIIIGHSAFALVALEYAKKYKENVSCVVMIGISPSLSSSMAALAERNWQESVCPERKKALENREKQLPDEELNKFPPSIRFVAWCFRRGPRTWYDYNFDSSFLWEGMHPHMQMLDYLYGVALRDLDITKGLENFDKPIFLALGRFDFIIAPSSSWDSVRPNFKDLTVKIFERSGHSPHYEESKVFDQELLSWLSSRLKKNTKKIVVTSYSEEWSKNFQSEALKIKGALGDNCIAVHHVGSTSIPGLLAKPIIDMVVVVKKAEKSIQPLESLDFKYKGEYHIPMRYYFNRSEGVEANLHVYEEGHPEIELNLLFRDYLRNHLDAREEYAKLKMDLLKEKSSYEKNGSSFTGYNLGKNAFIKKALQAANFNRIRLMKCIHHLEWDAAKRLRKKYFFDPLSIEDPYTWTFDHKEHAHLVLYKGVEIIGYAHIQFWKDQRAALRIIVIDEEHRGHGLGSEFLKLCEKWLKKQGVKSIHDEARPNVISFYRKNGYSEMPFDDPSGESPSPCDIAMGKML